MRVGAILAAMAVLVAWPHAGAASAKESRLTVTRLRWDGLENPLGIYSFAPHLSWAVQGSGRARKQTAYQVLVASAPRLLEPGCADVWDSGRVSSSESINIDYRGRPLTERQSGVWVVRVWDEAGRPSTWSGVARFEMTPVEEEVEGQMIGAPAPASSATAVYLRKSFRATGPLRQARLYASAEGAYEIHVNGTRVGTRVLAPGWIGYRRWRRTLFQTYDVTKLIERGENVVAAIGGGAWCTVGLGGGTPECGGDPGSVMVVLELTSTTGDVQTIRSDETWKARGDDGPLRTSHLYDGESYDARREVPGWDRAGFDDRAWLPARRHDVHELNPFHDLSPPITIAETLSARRLGEPRPGTYVFDLGQNIVGWARLHTRGRRGTEIVMRFGEAVNPDGSLYMANLGAARATDRYVLGGLGGEGGETWEPRFTVHGFRYVEVTGLARRPPLDTIVGRVVHSEMPRTGWLETSDPVLNRLYANIVWSQKGGFLGVPTRGPQRDERVGALLDGQLFAATACLNMDVQGVLRKWIDDLRDSQRNGDALTVAAPRVNDVEAGAGAGDAGIIVPFAAVLCYADRQVTDTFLPVMARWLDRVSHDSPHFLRASRVGATDEAVIATAFYAHSADLLARTFRFMGSHYDDYAARYELLFANIKKAFAEAYVRPDGHLVGDSQTAYALAIRFGLLTGAARERAGSWLVEDIERHGAHLVTDVVGGAHLLPALSALGRDDVAYHLLMQQSCPSWFCSVKNGATTVWERFDGWTPEGGFAAPAANSFNHQAWGAVGEWLYAAVGGIELDPAMPAGKHVFVRPRPGGGLTHASARFDSLHGSIRTRWRLSRENFTLAVDIPANTTATVTLPYPGPVTEGGRALETGLPGLQVTRVDDRSTTLEVQSGHYELEVRAAP